MKQARVTKWKKVSDLEVLASLKKEIERIGIADYPSKTKFNQLSDRNNCPSATSLLTRFDTNWETLMEMIGLEYDKKTMSIEKGKKGKGVPRKPYETKWTTMSDDDMLDILQEELNKLGTRAKQEYADRRSKGEAPSTNTIMKRFGSWSGAINRLEERKCK